MTKRNPHHIFIDVVTGHSVKRTQTEAGCLRWIFKGTKRKKDCFMKGASTVKWTTLDPCMGLSESGLKQYTSFELCEKGIMNNFKVY